MIILTAHPAIRALRVGAAAIMLIHGIARIVAGGVVPFGGFLDSMGVPFGVAAAWAITLVEIVGALAMASGRWVAPLALWFAGQLIVGIVLVHWQAGWFVVGLGRNGMEFSALLILCFGCLAWIHAEEKRQRDEDNP